MAIALRYQPIVRFPSRNGIIPNMNKVAKLTIIVTGKRGPLMSKLTFRNSHGNLVDIPTVAATKVKNEFGAILEKATHGGAVAITRHDTPKAVLISYDEFQSLVGARSLTLDALGSEFDALLRRMQTPKARKGMRAAFNASPTQLGRAAVKAASKRR
jgi:prevent-host-death family protein